jgi:hypothetical protein
MPDLPKVSEILRQFIAAHEEKGSTIREMVHFFGDRAFGFLLLVFALICIIPLPIPGIHMFLSLPLFYLSFQQMVGRREIWFPEKVLNYRIPGKALADVGIKTVPWVEKLENISKVRMIGLTDPFFFRIFGATVFYITAFIAIPLPLTNLVPAVGIAIMAVGILVKDGLALIVGATIGVIWSLMWYALVFYIGAKSLILFYDKILHTMF